MHILHLRIKCGQSSYEAQIGYRKGANGKPEIVPEEAEIVREIFRSYLDGMSLAQLADR
ncbi:MAG: recombinase family protein [Oscillospiraceae bacterium]|nr:recombinase family protein [Oscillospiraceae bacterium]